MGEFRPPLRSDYPKEAGEKWYVCHLCGAQRIRGLVHFDSGSVTPTEGETLTGATSGDTMVLENYVLISGTFAGGDAVGIIEGTSPTGYDDGNLEIFQDNEALNGSTSGNDFATVNKTGAVSISGRLIPESEIIEYQGKFYCRPHFLFKHAHVWEDEEKIDTADEGDRD
jgi:hypothetical protein